MITMILGVGFALEARSCEQAVELVTARQRKFEEDLRAEYGDGRYLSRALADSRRQYARLRERAFAYQVQPLLALGSDPLQAAASMVKTVPTSLAGRRMMETNDGYEKENERKLRDQYDGNVYVEQQLEIARAKHDRRMTEFAERLALVRPEAERRNRAVRSWYGSVGETMVEAFVKEAMQTPGWSKRDYPDGVEPDEASETAFGVMACGIGIQLAWLIVWAFVFRGGLSFWIAGIDVVRSDGRRAGRLRCTWRALLLWGPPSLLALLALAVECFRPEWLGVPLALWLAAVVWLVACLGLALRWPERGPHDVLAGTQLVPR
jgi:hypothetical protein